jgi:hypothetical protein
MERDSRTPDPVVVTRYVRNLAWAVVALLVLPLVASLVLERT